MLFLHYAKIEQLAVCALSKIKPSTAKIDDLLMFHDASYIEALQLNQFNGEYGLEHDCPPFQYLWSYICYTAGGTLSAIRWLLAQTKVDSAPVAIHWAGGRHHAQAAKASGFCYVNDCVLGLLKLREHFNRVLYLDLDIHHGDAVEKAFQHSSQVLTVSFHHYAPGFFPSEFRSDSSFRVWRSILISWWTFE